MGCTLSYRGGGTRLWGFGDPGNVTYWITQVITFILSSYQSPSFTSITSMFMQFSFRCYINFLAHTLSFNLNSYDSIFYLIAVYYLYMVSIHSMTHISFIQYYNGIFDSKDAKGLRPTRYQYPAKTIGYSQFIYLRYLVTQFTFIIIFTRISGLRGNAPMISLGGNSLSMNGI